MGKAATRKRTTKFKGDPVVDQLAVAQARGTFFTELFGIGWRLALVVLIPIFIAVQLDKKFDTAPSLTLAAFFIAIFMAGMLIAKTYSQIQADQLVADMKAAKQKRKRSQNV